MGRQEPAPIEGTASAAPAADGSRAPIPVSDFNAKSYLKERMGEIRASRHEFERNWYRNCLLYVGAQWISYSRSTRRWRRAEVPDWFPTPVTNRFASNVDGMVSVFEQSKPQSLYGPASDNEEDLATAKVANDVTDVVQEEVEIASIRQKAAKWLTMTGDVFLLNWYDNDPRHGEVFVQSLACQDIYTDEAGSQMPCGFVGQPHETKDGCPRCGQDNFIPAVDPATGKPIGVNRPRGKLRTDVLPPFSIYVDLQVRDLDDAPYVIIARTYSVETVRQRWPKTGADVKPEGAGEDLGQFYLNALSYVTNSAYGDLGMAGGSYKGQGGTDRVTVYELFVRPSDVLPKGAHAFIAGDVELEKRELDYVDGFGVPFINIVHMKFKEVAGRFFGKTPADDLVYKQIQRNKIEALIQLIISRMANPIWLIPDGTGVGHITGEPGEKIHFNLVGNPPIRPERVAGEEVPSSLFKWLTQIDADFEELSAMYDVLKGASPTNVPTLGGLELLKERGFARFRDALNSWEAGWLKWNNQMLWIFRQFAVDARMKAVKRDNGDWAVKKFTNADLRGNVVIRAEAGSTHPRSEAYQQFITGQLINMQLVDMADPLIRLKVFQRFNATDLIEPLNIDVRDAIMEKDEFLKTGQVRFNPVIDNNGIHAMMHKKWAKTEEFRSLPPEAQAAWTQHIEMTDMATFQEALREQQKGAIAKLAGTVPVVGPAAAAGEFAAPQTGTSPGQQAGIGGIA